MWFIAQENQKLTELKSPVSPQQPITYYYENHRLHEIIINDMYVNVRLENSQVDLAINISSSVQIYGCSLTMV